MLKVIFINRSDLIYLDEEVSQNVTLNTVLLTIFAFFLLRKDIKYHIQTLQ